MEAVKLQFKLSLGFERSDKSHSISPFSFFIFRFSFFVFRFSFFVFFSFLFFSLSHSPR